MQLTTLRSLAYPITVTKILRRVNDEIAQNAPLFTYRYKATNSEFSEEAGEYVEKERTYLSDFESEVEGTVVSLNIKVGQVIGGPTLVAEIEEPCKHEVQFGGMCANCGKDMTVQQYNTTSLDTSRATVNTVHGHTALLVSREEAGKADEEAKRRLLDARKLSLVVDLDQTIIHATVDPTVGDWQKDTANPNHDAVKNVRSFQLIDDGPGGRGTWYYIKLRPGLSEFLEAISQDYELHIYTMATRAYAENIAKIVDPDRKLFGERILSRDENGSMSSKNLKRLFPMDQKMVVIIDDRGDVWSWSPNLVKVVPYDFFVGIGDINSSFLPKRPELEARPAKPKMNGTEEKEIVIRDSQKPRSEEETGDVSTVERMMSMAGNQDEETLHQQTDEQDKTIAAQLEDRPLERMQKLLEKEEKEAKTSPAVTAAGELLNADDNDGDVPEEESTQQSRYRHNLLQDDDDELRHLQKSLQTIHSEFFVEYDRDLTGTKGGRVAELRPGQSKKRPIGTLENIPDAAVIMTDMKAQALTGVHLVFSGVIPIGVDPQTHDIGLWAKSFGATISNDITKRTTHLIASPERRTAKVRQAAKRGSRIAIVNQNWLYACFSQWRLVEEAPYRIHSDAPANGVAGLPGSFDDKGDALSESDEESLPEDEPPTGTQTPSQPLDTELALREFRELAPNPDRKDSSPTETENPDDWGQIEDDVNEFLGSDWDDDEDTDLESDAESRNSEDPDGDANRKRKRGESEERDLLGVPEGSRLQKRKNQAISRTTSLTNVANIEDEDSNMDDHIGKMNGSQDDDDDLDLEAELAAELERQMNDD